MHSYGWKRDNPDMRDRVYTSPFLGSIPDSVDLRSKCPPIYDQGQLGSCTANAIAGAIEFDQTNQGLTENTPSRLFIYYNERAKEGTVSSDSGASIRDGISSVHKLGVCSEDLWPYDITAFTDKPDTNCYTTAKKQRISKYSKISRSLLSMTSCLASGYPFVFGFTVYQSFESKAVDATGDVPMPQATESVLGGHAVVAVGYDNSKQRFIFRNSWGTSWGKVGYGTMPYAYLLDPDLASDMWVMNTIGG